MTDREICLSYKEAKKKAEQIKILSELTLKPVDEIKAILIANGYKVQGKVGTKVKDRLDAMGYVPEVEQGEHNRPRDDTIPNEAELPIEAGCLEALATVEKLVLDEMEGINADIEELQNAIAGLEYKKSLLNQFLAAYCS